MAQADQLGDVGGLDFVFECEGAQARHLRGEPLQGVEHSLPAAVFHRIAQQRHGLGLPAFGEVNVSLDEVDREASNRRGHEPPVSNLAGAFERAASVAGCSKGGDPPAPTKTAAPAPAPTPAKNKPMRVTRMHSTGFLEISNGDDRREEQLPESPLEHGEYP